MRAKLLNTFRSRLFSLREILFGTIYNGEGRMKLVKFNLILILLVLTLMGCSLEPSEIGNGPSQSTTIFIPVINQLPTQSAKALIPPEEWDTAVDFYGTMFLPQLTHFIQTTTADVSLESFSIRILGETVNGEFEIGPENNQYTLKYHLEDDGYIEVNVDSSGTFNYKQYLLIDVGGAVGIMYMIHTIEGGHISQNGIIGEYTERGQLYYGILQENESGTSTSILPYDIGNARTYIRGTESMVYGIVDPYVVNDLDSLEESDLHIADKPKTDITVSDLLLKLDEIQSFAYARSPDNIYPMNDLYYDFYEDRYSGYLSCGGIATDDDFYPSINTRNKEGFEDYTGFSFADLGYPQCNDLFQFLGDSLGLTYSLIGDGDNTNWKSIGDYTAAEFGVEESSIYMVPPGFNILDNDKNLLAVSQANEGGEILELSADTTYYIGFLTSKFSLDEMSCFSYLFQLD